MATGGAAGSVLRYLVSGVAQRALVPGAGALASFPAGTLVVNVTGSLLIGLLAGLAESRALLGPEARLLLVTGLLGGYTTFSAFSLETLVLLRAGQTGTAFATVGLQVLLGVAAAWAGFTLALGRPA
ncbi:MAG: fluoride efflux transporter CrcB [Chromatiales bacterium]|nr:fluoride efflux transporter CrcB [Chromatiales bacterium]